MTPIELEQARKDAGLTQKEMANQMNVGLSTYKYWVSLEEFYGRMKTNVELRFERWKNRG